MMTTSVARPAGNNSQPIPTELVTKAGFPHGAAKCERAVVKRPHECVTDQYLIDSKWQSEGWAARPEFNALAREHFILCKKLQEYGVGLRYQSGEWVVSLNSLMVRDASIVTPNGSVIQCLIKDCCRTGEPGESAEYLHQLGLNILGAVELPGEAVGSDFVWINSEFVIAAITPHTNEEGIDQVEKLLKTENPDIRVERLNLSSSYQAASGKLIAEDKKVNVDCKLCNCISVIRRDLVVLCPDTMPDRLMSSLHDLNIDIIQVSLDEWNAFGADIVALSPHRCLMIRTTEVPLGGTDDVIQVSDPAYRLHQVLHKDYQMKCNFVHLNQLLLSRNGLNTFIHPYYRSDLEKPFSNQQGSPKSSSTTITPSNRQP